MMAHSRAVSVLHLLEPVGFVRVNSLPTARGICICLYICVHAYMYHECSHEVPRDYILDSRFSR